MWLMLVLRALAFIMSANAGFGIRPWRCFMRLSRRIKRELEFLELPEMILIGVTFIMLFVLLITSAMVYLS